MNKQAIYKQIEKEYENERNKNALIVEKRKAAVYSRLPIVKDIDLELKQLGISVARLAIRHAPTAEIDKLREQINMLNKKKSAALASIKLTDEYLSNIYTCQDCKDTGYIGSKKCSCMNKKLIQKYYSISNLENVLINENFDHFDLSHYSDEKYDNKSLSPLGNMSNILENVLAQTSGDNVGYFNFYFYGNSGLGKTFMCSCIAKALLDKGLSVIYMTAHSLATLLEKNRFHKDDFDEDDEAVDVLFTADLLIIDDLGTESPNSFIASEIFNVLNNRIINEKSTVISSNLAPVELSALYSDRVVSRIVGSYIVHHFYGSDIRMK